jgi:hypothetical protein
MQKAKSFLKIIPSVSLLRVIVSCRGRANKKLVIFTAKFPVFQTLSSDLNKHPSYLIMNNHPSNPAAPGPSGRPAATLFNALPPQQMPPQRSSNNAHPRNLPTRGRNASRSRTPYVPRRQPQEPQLPVTFAAGGRALPNSEAELAAHAKALIEFKKELEKFNEAIEALRSRSRGSKRSHHGPSDKGNGNYNNDSNPDANPDAFAQHRERARSPPGSQLLSPTTANLMGKPIKIRSSRPPTKPWPTRQPNWPTRPPKYGN